MFLTQPQLSRLLAVAKKYSCSEENVQPGTVLQTKNANAELILVQSGWCRVIDPSRQFGSYTVTRVEAPYLCGLLPSLDDNISEEIIASSDCKIVLLSQLKSDPDFDRFASDIIMSRVSPSELPLVQQVVSDGLISIPSDQQFVEIYQRRWRPLSEFDLENEQVLDCIYADRPSQGFQYGQVTTTKSFIDLWSGPLPRALVWSDGDQDIDIPSTRSLDFPTSPSFQVQQHVETHVQPHLSLVTEELEQDFPQSASTRESDYAVRIRQLGFTPVTRSSADKSFEAIFLMIRDYFSLPTRRDTLSKATAFMLDGKGPSLQKLNIVFDRFGLLARSVSCRVQEVSRIPTPAIALSDTHPILIVDTLENQFLCIDPIEGIKLVSSEELSTGDSSVLEVISVSRCSSTPSSRFGFRWMLPYLSFYKFGLLEVFIASFITQLFALATPLLFQQIIDRVIGQGSSSALGGFAALMALFMLLELAFSSLRTFQFMEISNRIDINIGSSIISRLLRLNARFFEKRPVGELSSRLNELDKIRSFLTGTALTVVLDAIFALLYFTVMFFYSPVLAGVILASIPLLLAVILGLTPITQNLIRQRAIAHSKTNSYMVEVLNGIQTVKLQNGEFTARRNWESRHLDDINKSFKSVVANTASSSALQFINKTTNIIVICVGASLVLNNEMTLGQLIAFRIISSYVTQPILRLASTWNSFQEVSMSVERLGDVVNQPLETSDNEMNNISMPPIKGHVVFDEVSFGYGVESKNQLSGVSLDISAGSFTGIVGQSGCGKSTLLKLLPRLYEPTQGKILIDGFDVSKIELYSLRSQLGFVPQDCLLFEGTIFDNISVADPEVEAEKVIAASKLACAHEFIMSLPLGYNTQLGEKGSGLSGGQRQRVALARMILQKPGLVILDEATSALDLDTEQQVVTNLRHALHGTTIIMITHRLSTLIEADQIALMHDGRLDSIGTHDQLMSQAGRYFALYKQQLVG